MGYTVAIVGATGMVGGEYIKVIEERNFPADNVVLLASDRSAGKKLRVKGKDVIVRATNPTAFKGVDLVFLAAESDISKEFTPVAARAGAVVVDESSAFRMEPDVPLVVPEVNPEDIKWHKGIIASPNCIAVPTAMVLKPLHSVNKVRRVIISTYQSTSGWGAAAMEELKLQAREVLDNKKTAPKVFYHQIAFNVFPEIDKCMDNGYTKEEWKLAEETKKIMHAPEIAITSTCVRVPTYIGHCQALTVEFERPMSPTMARAILGRAPGVKVVDDIANHEYPTPWEIAGTDEAFVGRIREDTSKAGGLTMWIVADNTRKGSALNGVQIAEEMLKREWLKVRR
ncbi:MAG: aspartate-semialdehyde dehydrogenase [Chloroflexota bacterium]